MRDHDFSEKRPTAFPVVGRRYDQPIAGWRGLDLNTLAPESALCHLPLLAFAWDVATICHMPPLRDHTCRL